MKKRTAQKRTTAKRIAKKRTQKRQSTKAAVPPANGNPFRPQSSYFRIYNILAAHPEGISRRDALKAAMRACKKDTKHAGFDLSVLTSARGSATGKRHQSCRVGFYVERDGDLLKLRTS